MKYIKSFNESKDNFKIGVRSLEEFCKNNLAYLVDSGFTYDVNTFIFLSTNIIKGTMKICDSINASNIYFIIYYFKKQTGRFSDIYR